MNARTTLILPIALFSLCACNVGSDHREEETDSVKNIYDSRPVTGRITEVGEVDWYEFTPVQSGSQIAVEVQSDTLRADVELLVTMYQNNSNGDLVRIYADHAPEDSVNGADILMNYQLNNSEPVIISVRDLMDDEAASGDYTITAQEGLNDQGNDVLSGAIDIALDGVCTTDRIDNMGDVDLFSFNLSEAQIVNIQTTLNSQSASSVKLVLNLYGSDTLMLDSWSQSHNGVYNLTQYLDAGDYTLGVEDSGRDDFDLSAPYTTCVTTVENAEAMVDDELASATSYDLSTTNPTINGVISHQTDEDWSLLQLPTPAVDNLQLLSLTLAANTSSEDILYLIKDDNGDIIFSYVHSAGSSAFSQEILAGSGDHSLTVSLASGERLTESVSYSVDFEVTSVSDAAEVGAGNNLIDNAEALTNAVPVTGKIAYRGDIDWYVFEVTPLADTYQILDLSLTSTDESDVAYRMQVLLSEQILAADDPIVADNTLQVDSSLLIKPLSGTDSGARRYYVKVSDVYAEKSDAYAEYNLVANLRNLHNYDTSLLPASVNSSDLIFVDEADEQVLFEAEQDIVSLELNAYNLKNYAVNMDALVFRDPQTASSQVQRTENTDGTVSIELPWLGGYIDYSGDQDWYALELKDLGYIVDAVTEYPYADSDWHYQLQIELIAAAGEESEYQWRLYRDQGQNAVVRDRPTESDDGYFAQQGDADLTTAALSLTTEGMVDDDGKTVFWSSEDWPEIFYLAVSDFDFRTNPTTGETNPVTDADWSNAESPYFVRVKLLFVPEEHQP